MSDFDYIIVGAGSAGCVLANKLGADTSKNILILEAGPMDHNLMIHIPAGVYSAWRNPKINWNYQTEAEPSFEDRAIEMPRGKVVGGSSSINSMVYMRGHPLDYDQWETEHGLKGWSYADCLPYFKAGETSDRGADLYRGGSGPLGVSKGSFDNPLYDAFITAGTQANQGHSDDLNGYNPEGISRYDATKQHGRRCSAAVAHLRPALKRGNVTLLTRAHVKRLVMNGTKATGVIFDHKGAERHLEGAEIILSGGALNSPHLLMLSGIGPRNHLDQHNIECIQDLPVGQNLQDHASIILQYECTLSFPIHKVDHPIRKGLVGMQWVFTRKGMAASNIWEAGGLIRSNDTVDYPNIEYHFGPVGFEYNGTKITLKQAFAIHVDQSRPRSRGHVSLASNDPYAKPLMTFNYLCDPLDMAEMLEGVKKTRQLISQPAFNDFRGPEMVPGPHVQSDEDLIAWIRQDTATDFHPCGTCRMGHGKDAVVDEEFRVIGTQNLRVVDASIIPTIPCANLNAPTQMIAARAADIIAGKPQLPPIHAPFAFQ